LNSASSIKKNHLSLSKKRALNKKDEQGGARKTLYFESKI